MVIQNLSYVVFFLHIEICNTAEFIIYALKDIKNNKIEYS